MSKLARTMLTMMAVGALAAFGAAAPMPTEAAECFSCAEGCTGGEACYAYSKCEGKLCEPTVQNTTCRSLHLVD